MNKTSKLMISITLAGVAFTTSSWAVVTHTNAAAAKTSTAQQSTTTTTATPAKQADNPYEVAGISSAKDFHQFFFKFQQAVQHNKKATVASMVNYPLHVNSNGKTHTIKNKATFIAKYDSIMTPEIKRTLAYAIEEDLFVNWQGVMVGSGELWFNQSNDKIGLDAVNL